MRLVFASNNAHKLEEVRAIMPSGIEVLSLREIGFEQEIEENGATLEENSRIKAETVWEYVKGTMDKGQRTMDNGHGTMDLSEKEIFAANRAKALRELAGKTNRGAQFKTVVTLILKHSEDRFQHSDLQVKGVVRGQIATEERGQGGFGYDPLFIPEGYEHTFAELPIEVKNSISHRARAMEALVQTLHEIA